MTSASLVSVSVSNTPCSNCSALTTSGFFSNQANAYGGSISVVQVGAYAWSTAFVGSFSFFSRSYSDTTWVTDLSVFIADAATLLTKAFSSKCLQFCACLHV
jgi:hypothetical protein